MPRSRIQRRRDEPEGRVVNVRVLIVVETVPLRRRLVRLLRSQALPMAPRERLDLLGPERLIERARRESAHLMLVETALLARPAEPLCEALDRLPSCPWVLEVAESGSGSRVERAPGTAELLHLDVSASDDALSALLAGLVVRRRRELVTRLIERFGPAVGPPEADAPVAARDVANLPLREARRVALEAFERAYFTELLRRTGGRIGETARLADIDPRSLFDKLDLLGLHKEDFRPRAGGERGGARTSPEREAQSIEQAPGPRGSPQDPQGPGGNGAPPAAGP